MITEPQIGGTYEDLLRLAIWAEAQGLDAFGRSDHYLAEKGSAPVTDALTTLAGARERDPADPAGGIGDARDLPPSGSAGQDGSDPRSNGEWTARNRRWDGMDCGANTTCSASISTTRAKRFAMLEETLEYLLAASEGGDYAGRRYALKSADVFPRPSREMQIIVGGRGLKRTPGARRTLRRRV